VKYGTRYVFSHSAVTGTNQRIRATAECEKTYLVPYFTAGGISLALSDTTKHKCRAPPKFKQWLNIVIQGRRDLFMMHTTLPILNA
jgi:hypothetical protein